MRRGTKDFRPRAKSKFAPQIGDKGSRVRNIGGIGGSGGPLPPIPPTGRTVLRSGAWRLIGLARHYRQPIESDAAVVSKWHASIALGSAPSRRNGGQTDVPSALLFWIDH